MSLKNIYLRLCCIFLAAQSFFSCETWAFHCDGCSYCRAQASGQSHLSSFGTRTQQLQLTGSRARARQLWYPAACGIFSDQGLNPCPLHWQVDSQPLDHQGTPTYVVFRLLQYHQDSECNSSSIVDCEDCVCMFAQSLGCPTLCDPMDYSLPGSSVHEISQARIISEIV